MLDALTYPLRNHGWLVLFLGAVLTIVLEFCCRFSMLGGLIAFFAAGYFCAFYLGIVESTITGHDDIPEWPSVTNYMEDLLVPWFQIACLSAVSFGPYFVLNALGFDESAWSNCALAGGLLYGCFYFPMGLIALAVSGRLTAVLPHVVFPAIFRCLPNYLLSCFCFAVVAGICLAAEWYLRQIPWVGWPVACVISLYSLMFQGRYIGLIYRDKRELLDG